MKKYRKTLVEPRQSPLLCSLLVPRANVRALSKPLQTLIAIYCLAPAKSESSILLLKVIRMYAKSKPRPLSLSGTGVWRRRSQGHRSRRGTTARLLAVTFSIKTGRPKLDMHLAIRQWR